MTTLASTPLGAKPIKAAWRRYSCYRFTAPFTAPAAQAIRDELTDRVRVTLAVDFVTPVFKNLTDGAWLCIFFHGSDRVHHTSTYEQGKPGSVAYHLREAATFIFDPKNRILYLSTAKHIVHKTVLASTLGLLVPEGTTFEPYSWNLKKASYLPASLRNPPPGSAAWDHLVLKMVNCSKPGYDSAYEEYRSQSDLYDEPDFIANHHLHIYHAVTFSAYIPSRKRPHAIQFFANTPCIRATITTDTLDSLAAITALIAKN